jgi:hypothetical protein
VTKPRSNHCELPDTAVIAVATQPPVQDSAVASFSPRALSRAPTKLAKVVKVSWAIGTAKKKYLPVT